MAKVIRNGPGFNTVITFKSCPRCSGDRCLDRDSDGWYMTCLQCGHVTYPEVFPERTRLACRVRERSPDHRVPMFREAGDTRVVSAVGG